MSDFLIILGLLNEFLSKEEERQIIGRHENGELKSVGKKEVVVYFSYYRSISLPTVKHKKD